MKDFLNLKNLFLLAIILTALGAIPRLNALVTRSVFGEDDVDDGSVYALVALASSNLSISLSKFYTDTSSAPLSTVHVLFNGNTVSGTNPNEILAWIKVTNTGLLSLQSLSTNETLPVDWSINPPWMMPSKSAIHSFFQFTNGSAVEITDPSGISATTGNPQGVVLNISNISGTSAGKSLAQNESILLSVKLRYALIGTTQSPSSYPRNYSDSASAVAWTGANFSGASASSSNSAIFIADACGIACSSNITVPNQTDKCGATVNYPAPMTTGTGCGMVTCTPAPGFFFPVGTTTVNCTTDAGASCSFAVMVTDTQPPTITCPGSISAAAAASCPIASAGVVTFPNPSASDNCGTPTVVCNPPSGSPFPPGTTTVTCTATDASGNTASCSFTVTAFSFCLQDETNPGNLVLINAQTGEYLFFCNGVQIASGKGTLTTKGCIGSIEHNKGDRRVYMEWDTSAEGKGKGTAIVQLGVNNTRCQITDKSMNNNTCTQPAQAVSPVGKPGKLQSRY